MWLLIKLSPLPSRKTIISYIYYNKINFVVFIPSPPQSSFVLGTYPTIYNIYGITGIYNIPLLNSNYWTQTIEPIEPIVNQIEPIQTNSPKFNQIEPILKSGRYRNTTVFYSILYK